VERVTATVHALEAAPVAPSQKRTEPTPLRGDSESIRALIHVTENREEAARILGISRRALQYKLKSYGLLKRPEETAGETGDGIQNTEHAPGPGS
jgi:DNA-binding NtrC family response regulator